MIVAVVGHVDHGKTALVQALTGIDTDRLPEEKARGLSIDMGFAWRRTADGLVAFIDLPGHERYMRNMLAGLGHVDLALVVVAADDGVMPQTREHVAALDLLGISRAAIVVTKTDRVDAARVQATAAQARALLAPTTLNGAPVFRVAAIIGLGVAALASHLDRSARQLVPASRGAGLARLAIDRVFTVTGAGTVITGTVIDGRIAVGDELLLSPAGRPARVRRLQMHDREISMTEAGNRCAVNLAGIDCDAVRRGDWLVCPAVHAPTRTLDVRLRVAPGAPPLRHDRLLQLHVAASAVQTRVLLMPADAVPPGGEAHATLRLETDIAAWRGDRFLLRDPAGAQVVAGGEVLDPLAAAPMRRAPGRLERLRALAGRHDEEVLAALARQEHGFVDLAWFGALCRREGEQLDAVVQAAGLIALPGGDGVAPLAVAPDRLDEWLGTLVAALAAMHRAAPASRGETLASLAAAMGLPVAVFGPVAEHAVRSAALQREGGLLRLPAHATRLAGQQQALWARVRRKLEQLAHDAPRLGDLAQRLSLAEPALAALLRARVRQGEVLRLGPDRFALRSTAHAVAAIADRVACAQPGGQFSAAQFRDALGTGRGMAIAWLECLDRQRVTVRRGDLRRLAPGRKPVLAVLGTSAARRRDNWRHRYRFGAAKAAT